MMEGIVGLGGVAGTLPPRGGARQKRIGHREIGI